MYDTLKFMYKMCFLHSTILQTKRIETLKTQKLKSIELTRYKCCCLLALAFFNRLEKFNFNIWVHNDTNKTAGLFH